MALRTRKIAPVRRNTHTGAFEAQGSTGKWYRVVIGPNGSACECIAGQNGRRCYHVHSVIASYAVEVKAPWARGPKPSQPAEPAKTQPKAEISDLYA